MVRLLVAFALSLAVVQPAAPISSQQPPPASPIIVVDTVKGAFEIATYHDEAPKSVDRILALARRNFYRGQRFHWVQEGLVQFGDPLTRDFTKEADWGIGGSGVGNRILPIGVAEVSKRRFERATVGLAYRPGQPPVNADSQIFILRFPNPALNGKYAVIGRVIKGMEIIDKIARADLIKQVSVRDVPRP